ncbi:MAG: hypothetical protein IK083_07705 [Abditibacteriota bacterium]|nr:hypothetical protein [Abditibacteriota bacterium]
MTIIAALVCAGRLRAACDTGALRQYRDKLSGAMRVAELAEELAEKRAGRFEPARRVFEQTLARAEACLSLAEQARTPSDWKKVAERVERLTGFDRRRALAEECRQEARRLREEEQERLRETARARLSALRDAGRRLLIPALIVAAIVVSIVVSARRTGPDEEPRPASSASRSYTPSSDDGYYYSPEDTEYDDGVEDNTNDDEDRYREAADLFENGEYDEARDIFEDLGDYKNSSELAELADEKADREIYAPSAYDYDSRDDDDDDYYDYSPGDDYSRDDAELYRFDGW